MGIVVPLALLIIGLISYSLYVKIKYRQPYLRAIIIMMCCECDKISHLSNRAKIEDQAMQEAKNEEEKRVKEEMEQK